MDIFDQIKQEFILPTAREDWADYRRRLTGILCSLLREMSSAEDALPALAILGAGAANDIDLRMLRKCCSRLTLFDQDEEALQLALRQYDLQKDPAVQLRIQSFTGIEENDIRGFFRRMYRLLVREGRNLTTQTFLTAAETEIRQLASRNRTQVQFSSLAADYDLVVCIGVHSQLLSLLSYSYEVLRENAAQQLFRGHPLQDEGIRQLLCTLAQENAVALNTAILQMTRKAALIGCEEDTLHPIAGAAESIIDIRQRCAEDISLSEMRLHWPFRPAIGKEYTMLLQLLRRNK